MEAVPEAESEALEPPESTDRPGTGPPEHTEVEDAPASSHTEVEGVPRSRTAAAPPAAAPPTAVTEPKRRRRLRAAGLRIASTGRQTRRLISIDSARLLESINSRDGPGGRGRTVMFSIRVAA